MNQSEICTFGFVCCLVWIPAQNQKANWGMCLRLKTHWSVIQWSEIYPHINLYQVSDKIKITHGKCFLFVDAKVKNNCAALQLCPLAQSFPHGSLKQLASTKTMLKPKIHDIFGSVPADGIALYLEWCDWEERPPGYEPKG